MITDKAAETRKTFHALLDKTNKEHPNPKDIKALSDLLSGNRKLELWRDVASVGYLAEFRVIENAHATAGLKECWKHRLQVLKKDYSSTMAQSHTLTLGVYWENRLSAAQKCFTQACETLARVRKLSRNTPALQFNIATSGGQQVNVAK